MWCLPQTLGYAIGSDTGRPDVREDLWTLPLRVRAPAGRSAATGALLTQDDTGGMNLAPKADAFFVRTEAENRSPNSSSP